MKAYLSRKFELLLSSKKQTEMSGLGETLAFRPGQGRRAGEPSPEDRRRLQNRKSRGSGAGKENAANRGSAASSSSLAGSSFGAAAATPSRRGMEARQRARQAATSRQRQTAFAARPSAKLDRRRTNNPFASSATREKSKFAQAYADGAVPCRINHGGVKHQLQWDVPPQTLDYEQMLPVFAHGLSETRHPYVFVAQHGFTQLLTAPEAPGKVVSVLPTVIVPLRAALGSKDKEVTKNALHACHLLSNVVKGALNPYLPQLLIPIKRRCFDRNFQELITELLGAVENNGGEPALVAIKKKVPTYQSVFAF